MRWSNALRLYSKPAGIGIGLAALTAVALHAWRQRVDVLALWQHSNVMGVATAFLLCVAAQSMFGLAWHRLALGAGMPATLREDMQRWGLSLLAKYLPGKVWQGLARSALYGDTGNAGRIFGLFVREQMLSLGSAAMVVTLIAPPALSPAFQPVIQFAFAAGGIILVLLSGMGHIPAWAPAVLHQWMLPVRGWAVMQAWLLNLIAYGLLCGGFAILAWSLGYDSVDLSELAAGLCFSGLTGVTAFFIPAGLGVREAGLVWYLGPTMGSGNAAALALAARIWLTFGEVFVSLAAFLAMRNMLRHGKFKVSARTQASQ